MSSSAATRRWWSLFCVCPAHFHCPPKVSARINAHIPCLPLYRERASVPFFSLGTTGALPLSFFLSLFVAPLICAFFIIARCLVVVVAVVAAACQFITYGRVSARSTKDAAAAAAVTVVVRTVHAVVIVLVVFVSIGVYVAVVSFVILSSSLLSSCRN